ncbi:PAS domain-containing protein [Pseudomonas sp. GD03944]|uniref:PAS domain-containing protein n=1 Tax=Pseudomonas sp. GD03944 TaxID=2975409 RepID=UPI0024479830|nr:PAS domain-containing protein [Pseudomonas sp. GD03944]MDH1262439.1 PAS domain-containing protein [Pseudomonas sp. GD03944]
MPTQIDIKEVHWLLDIVQCIDVGVIVLDRQYRVEVWNSFMENHSGLGPDEVHGRPLFELFPEIDRAWLTRKVDTVVQLGTRAFSLWEQRPYLVHFKNYQPITGQEPFMYQNVTLLPLAGASGAVEHLCVVIYDMTAAATHKKQLEAARAQR